MTCPVKKKKKKRQSKNKGREYSTVIIVINEGYLLKFFFKLDLKNENKGF